MSARSIRSCVACGKAGHSARIVSVPGFVHPVDGSDKGYRCPLWSDDEFRDRNVATTERAYEEALAAEHKAVGSLPDRATERQLAHARAASERTNAAIRALRAARGEP